MQTVDRISTVDAATFSASVLSGRGPIVVEFMSYGCVHCRAMEPVLQDVAEQLAGKQQFFRVNIAVAGELADRYDIEATPTFVLFAGGREIGRLEGPAPQVASLTAALTHGFGT